MMMGFGFMVMLFLGFLFLLLILGGAVVFSQMQNKGPRPGGHRPDARQVLDERLARGEISPEEHEAIRKRIAQE